MQVTLKLYAWLGQFLPDHAQRNKADLDIAEGTTIKALLDDHHVPEAARHLVLVNGYFQPPEIRAETALTEGDVLAVWPPVAGG